VTAVASGCGSVVSLMSGKRLGSPPREQQPRTSHLRADADLVSLSVSILVSLPLCFKTRELHYLCISFITPEFM
jgi:hypothetical protein